MNKFMVMCLTVVCAGLFCGCEDDNSSGGLDLGSVVWLDQNISGWPETTSMSASVGGGSVNMPYDKANVWPGTSGGGATVNANAWVFVNQGGTWYAATWEYLRVGQTSKSSASVTGSHINHAPLSSWHPVAGETYGFMVSGLVRGGASNVEERSNVSMVTW